MVIGRGLVDRRGAGVLMGLVAGALVTFGTPGKEGLFEWTKYVAAGAVLDLLVWVVGNDLKTWWKAALVGAGAHLAKLVSATLMAWVLGLPLDVVAIGLVSPPRRTSCSGRWAVCWERSSSRICAASRSSGPWAKNRERASADTTSTRAAGERSLQATRSPRRGCLPLAAGLASPGPVSPSHPRSSRRPPRRPSTPRDRRSRVSLCSPPRERHASLRERSLRAARTHGAVAPRADGALAALRIPTPSCRPWSHARCSTSTRAATASWSPTSPTSPSASSTATGPRRRPPWSTGSMALTCSPTWSGCSPPGASPTATR